MIGKVLLLLVLVSFGSAEEVLRGELRLLRDGGQAKGGAGGVQGGNSHKADKINNALMSVHAIIDQAAEGLIKVKRATAVSSMLTNAAVDDTVSDDAMTALEFGGRKLSHVPSDDTMSAAAFATTAAIGKAAMAGKGAAQAARIGADMTHVATNHISDFAIDHVPDMDGGARKLMSNIENTDDISAMQNTAEAIMSLGAKAARMGNLNAMAASGKLHFVDQMSDTITHRAQTDRPSIPRKLLSA